MLVIAACLVIVAIVVGRHFSLILSVVIAWLLVSVFVSGVLNLTEWIGLTFPH